MEHNLVWGALAVGFACWLVGFGLVRTKKFGIAGIEAALPPLYLKMAVALPALLFILTLPSRGRFFAPGHDLGNGFLLGAAGALLSALLLIQNMLADPGERSQLRTAAAYASPYGLAVAAAAAAVLIKHDTLSVALLAVAIGWLATGVILMLGLMHGGRMNSSIRPEPLVLLSGTSFCAAVCAAALLGDFHGAVTFNRSSSAVSWGVVALAVAAAVPLFQLLSVAADLLFNPDPDVRQKAQAAPDRPSAGMRAAIGRTAIAAIGVALLGRLFAQRVIATSDDTAVATGRLANLLNLLTGTSRLAEVLVTGIIAGLLVWWITVSSAGRRDDQEASTAHPWQNSGLAMLVVLAGAMACYQMLNGFGVALMAIGMWPAVGSALLASACSEQSTADGKTDQSFNADILMRIVLLAAMGAILALFRVYSTLYDGDFPRTAYTDQYAVFGFVAGFAVPMFLASYLSPGRSSQGQSTWQPSVRLAITGLLVLAIPSVMLLLWGQKCIMAFLTALAITAAGVTLTSGATSIADCIRKQLAALYAIGISLALCEWSHIVLDAEDWTRIQKERVLVQMIGAVIVIVLAADYLPRLRGTRSAALPDATKGAVR